MSRKSIRIDSNGNSICTSCGAADFFTVTEDSCDRNPANLTNPKHPDGFCPFCGAEFTHVVEVDDLSEYKRWSE